MLLIRRMILRRIRKKSFYVANTNQAVLNLWQYAQRLALWGADPSEEEEALALKAKFSQHTITPEELEPYRASILQMAELTRLDLDALAAIPLHLVRSAGLSLQEKIKILRCTDVRCTAVFLIPTYALPSRMP